MVAPKREKLQAALKSLREKEKALEDAMYQLQKLQEKLQVLQEMYDAKMKEKEELIKLASDGLYNRADLNRPKTKLRVYLLILYLRLVWLAGPADSFYLHEFRSPRGKLSLSRLFKHLFTPEFSYYFFLHDSVCLYIYLLRFFPRSQRRFCPRSN